MNRDLERRLRRLELERDDGRTLFAISDEPLSDEEWAAGGAGRHGTREQPMGEQEWEATYCHEQRSRH
jgi:hypothetical protein